ncbi:EXS family protein [Plectosphaerella cucumerina]|uniref:EXS family protein n=1 Tax=Plectosphaerella cucumerina TaxID=40658 RepID=A0A8K0TSP1_9PEZI|nr:EXS family protein [Plectosphaerella cucumerina]
MDGDPKVDSELDGFSLTFPLPYRVAFIVILGAWGFGFNLQYLARAGIDLPSLIQYPTRTSATQPPHHLSTYRLATVLSVLFGLSISTFWLFTRRTPGLVIEYDWLPMTLLFAVAALFFVPVRSFTHEGRRRFLSSLRRVSIGGIAEARNGKFGDVLLADALTSYAKVMGDLYVATCMFFRTNGASTARPDRGCGGTVIVPLIMALPSAIRLRQCLTEYLRVRRAPYKESAGWGGQHLANAAKYSTAFPVIILGALLRRQPADQPSPALNRAWLAAVLLNSLYSFYWDVTKDWDMTLFTAARAGRDHPFGLRRRLVFRAPAFYYAVIAMDLVLRCTWALKLSPRLDRLSDFESSIFLLEFLEVFRRWVWIFFRVETEYIRETAGGPGDDDVLLGDYSQYSSDGDEYSEFSEQSSNHLL